jgi:hypothetical protein
MLRRDRASCPRLEVDSNVQGGAVTSGATALVALAARDEHLGR